MNYEKFQHKDKNIFLVDMTKELNPYFSEIVQMSIEKHLKEGKKIWILVNKKWYASGIICQKCGHIPQCKKCSVSISYHKISSGETIWLCHICKTQYNVPTSCPNCRSEKIKDFGLWTQKVAEFLKKEFKTDALVIESETVNSPNKIARLLDTLCHTESCHPEGTEGYKWDKLYSSFHSEWLCWLV